jgi:hypothetical protein
MVGMGLEVLVEEVGESVWDQEAENQGNVIDAFVNETQCGRHGGAPTRRGGKASLYRRGVARGRSREILCEHE